MLQKPATNPRIAGKPAPGVPIFLVASTTPQQKLTWMAGKSQFLMGDTSSKIVVFSYIVMLVFGGVADFWGMNIIFFGHMSITTATLIMIILIFALGNPQASNAHEKASCKLRLWIQKTMLKITQRKCSEFLFRYKCIYHLTPL